MKNNRIHVLLLWAAALVLAWATLIGFGLVTEADLTEDFVGWLVLGAALFVAAQAARET